MVPNLRVLGWLCVAAYATGCAEPAVDDSDDGIVGTWASSFYYSDEGRRSHAVLTLAGDETSGSFTERITGTRASPFLCVDFHHFAGTYAYDGVTLSRVYTQARVERMHCEDPSESFAERDDRETPYDADGDVVVTPTMLSLIGPETDLLYERVE